MLLPEPARPSIKTIGVGFAWWSSKSLGVSSWAALIRLSGLCFTTPSLKLLNQNVRVLIKAVTLAPGRSNDIFVALNL